MPFCSYSKCLKGILDGEGRRATRTGCTDLSDAVRSHDASGQTRSAIACQAHSARSAGTEEERRVHHRFVTGCKCSWQPPPRTKEPRIGRPQDNPYRPCKDRRRGGQSRVGSITLGTSTFELTTTHPYSDWHCTARRKLHTSTGVDRHRRLADPASRIDQARQRHLSIR